MDLLAFLNRPRDELVRTANTFVSQFARGTKLSATTSRVYAMAGYIDFTRRHRIASSSVEDPAAYFGPAGSRPEYERLRGAIWGSEPVNNFFAVTVCEAGGDASIIIRKTESVFDLIIARHRAGYRTAVMVGEGLVRESVLYTLDTLVMPLLDPVAFPGSPSALERLGFEQGPMGPRTFGINVAAVLSSVSDETPPEIAVVTAPVVDAGVTLSKDGNALECGERRIMLPSLSIVRGKLRFTKSDGTHKTLTPDPNCTLAFSRNELVFHGAEGRVAIPFPRVAVEGSDVVVTQPSGEEDRITVQKDIAVQMKGALSPGAPGMPGLVPAPEEPNHVLYGDGNWGPLTAGTVSVNTEGMEVSGKTVADVLREMDAQIMELQVKVDSLKTRKSKK